MSVHYIILPGSRHKIEPPAALPLPACSEHMMYVFVFVCVAAYNFAAAPELVPMMSPLRASSMMKAVSPG